MNEISKKQAAHEYALKMIGTLDGWDKCISSPDTQYIAKNAWDLADAMEQECLNRCGMKAMIEYCVICQSVTVRCDGYCVVCGFK